jgi:hypothetical protein
MWIVVVAGGIACGIAGRFWFALYVPRPPLTFDWTPLFYWLVGIFWALLAIRLARSRRAFLPNAKWRLMMSINEALIAAYLIAPIILVVRVFFSMTP